MLVICNSEGVEWWDFTSERCVGGKAPVRRGVVRLQRMWEVVELGAIQMYALKTGPLIVISVEYYVGC